MTSGEDHGATGRVVPPDSARLESRCLSMTRREQGNRLGLALQRYGGTLLKIRRTVQQIADVVSTIPGSSPFWSSMKDSLLQVDVQGWRLVYRILPDRREIRVIEMEALRR